MRSTLVALVLSLVVPGVAQERPLPELKPFVDEVQKRLYTWDERESSYMYVETRRQQHLDKNGRPTKDEVKVYESYPGLPGQERWNRLISEDGRPVPPAELDKQDRERQQKVQDYLHGMKDPAEQTRRARDREKELRKDMEEVDDAFRVFDIRMLRREMLEGHDTIVFSLTPRRDAKPRTRDGKIMRHFKAIAWVSESEYEVVRLEVEAIDDVPFALGLLARVHKGSRASFQQRKVNGEEWLPAEARYSASARVLLLKRYRVGGTSEFSGYRKFTVDTSATYARPK